MNTTLNSEGLATITKEHFETLKQSVNTTSFHQAELDFVDHWNALGQQVFEPLVTGILTSSQKKTPKKLKPHLGPVRVSNTHPFPPCCDYFVISPALQERMVYVGQQEPYEKRVKTLEKLSWVKVSRSQWHRVSDYYGKQLTATVNEERTLKPVVEKE